MSTPARTLQTAGMHAQAARFPEMLKVCKNLIATHIDNATVLLDVGVLLYNFGFLSQALFCFEKAKALLPHDIRPLVNLANIARDSGKHTESRSIYAYLQERLLHHPVVRRNLLVSLEYDPEVSDTDRLLMARTWGHWARAQAGGSYPRPVMKPLVSRKLRIGYVSADFCQHTVGLFIKDVLKSHNSEKVTAFAYSAGLVKDFVTDEIRIACRFRDVKTLDDSALVALIEHDEIDVLVDLSGHTAGSRLTVFARRPAAVQVSWLGYFATTGLDYIDAVLLDIWHGPPGMEDQFVEPIIRLKSGRFCYQPVPFAPEVLSSPFLAKGYVTFGCFNNTGKLNTGVFDLWARILKAVPNSRLVLKWRTFNDKGFRQSITEAFGQRGITQECFELRGPSFHADLLKEYGDIDIALDPFPFTGGLTSCEALWMGVPVVTWPQSRVVSRQTFAFLSAIGLPELAAKDAEEYVRIAVQLAGDKKRLAELRAEMRARMKASPLMDLSGFTAHLENTLIELYQNIATSENTPIMHPKTILHIGPGHRQSGAKLPIAFQTSGWREIRLDIDPVNEPDIIGSMLDMPAVASESMDAIYSSHNIEHVYAHEVPLVLKEFLRVLKPEGYVVITCPDLQAAAAMIAEDKLTNTAYQSPAGPITPLDIVYGFRPFLKHGNIFMLHKCGFTLSLLSETLQSNGFKTVAGKRRPAAFDLWVVATKTARSETELRTLAESVLPC